METNESILTREIVAIDDRKRLGKMKELCVDCDTLSVCHYIVNSASTNTALVLPFEKSLAVGDTFITIQSRDDLIAPSEAEAERVINEGFRLLGVEVFSQNGNRLGTVESYEYDTTHGKITKISLGKRLAFTADAFVFFAPDFVFVDDGEVTAFEVRHGVKAAKGKKRPVPRVFAKGSREASAKGATAAKEEAAPVEVPLEIPVEAPVKEAPAKAVVEPKPEPKPEPEPVVETGNEDDVLKEFLLDAIVSDDVESKDGSFKVAKGTKLTQALIDEAQKHDALLLLTMSVE